MSVSQFQTPFDHSHSSACAPSNPCHATVFSDDANTEEFIAALIAECEEFLAVMEYAAHMHTHTAETLAGKAADDAMCVICWDLGVTEVSLPETLRSEVVDRLTDLGWAAREARQDARGQEEMAAMGPVFERAQYLGDQQ